MLPGSHFRRTTYGPGLAGSPNRIACSLVPAALRTHLMSAGSVKSTMLRSTWARAPGVTEKRAIAARSVHVRPVRAMAPP